MIREKGIKPRTIGVEVISDAILARGVTEAAAYLYGCTVPIPAGSLAGRPVRHRR